MHVSGANDLRGVPGECRAIARYQHEPHFGTREEQRGVVQTKP